MVVAERETSVVAVKIQDHVSIYVSEVISLAPFQVDEPLHLLSELGKQCTMYYWSRL